MTFGIHAIRHPWLDTSGSKRKLTSTGEDDWGDDYLGVSSGISLRKRRRSQVLQHSFAHLTLNEIPQRSSPSLQTSSYARDPHGKSNVPPDRPSQTRSTFANGVTASSIEGLPSPDIDVIMDSEIGPHPHAKARVNTENVTDISEVEISPVLLERLNQQVKLPVPFIPTSPPSIRESSSQALVLFKPLRPPSPLSSLTSVEKEKAEVHDEHKHSEMVVKSGVLDENEMDIGD